MAIRSRRLLEEPHHPAIICSELVRYEMEDEEESIEIETLLLLIIIISYGNNREMIFVRKKILRLMSIVDIFTLLIT
jgi:hypothetical protein